MKIQTSKLRDILAIVKPGVASKEILEQTTSFAFLKGRVVTYNDEISISHPFESDFEGSIKADELYGLLSKISKDEVSLEMQENQLLVSAGRMKAGLKLETEILLPLRELPKKMEALPDPAQFSNLVGLAMRTCSADTSQPKLTCVSITQEGVITGSDSYRLIVCRGKKLPVKNFLLPAHNALEVIKLSPTHIALDTGWVHFKNKDNTVISCRMLDDEYVNPSIIEGILKLEKPSSLKFPDKIKEMLDRIRQFAKRDSVLDEMVEANVKEGKITLESTAMTTGSWIRESSTIDFSGEISFYMNPSLLQDILAINQTAELDKSLTKIKFKGEEWEYLVMLRVMPKAKK